MRVFSYDLETHLIQPGLLTPPIVCGSVAELRTDGETTGRLLTKTQAIDEAWRLITDPEVIIGGANIVFDLGCLAAADPAILRAIFEAYRQKRIHDLLIATSLNAIFHGHLGLEPNGLPLISSRGTQTDRYSLDICVKHWLGRTDAKDNDFWRMRYALLEHLPHAEWPWDAKQYPVDDVVNGALVTGVQRGLIPRPVMPLPMLDAEEQAALPPGFGPYPPFDNYLDFADQCETDWALHLGAVWGLRSDGSRVDLLEARAKELHEAYVAKFTKYGFFRSPREKYTLKGKVDPDAGKKDTAAVAKAVAKAYGATGTCAACRGTGHVPVSCRGEKMRGRYKGCPYAPGAKGTEACGCVVCQGVGLLFKDEGAICKTCVGSGFADLTLVPRSEAGGVSTSRDTLSESGDESLMLLGDAKHSKILQTYVPYLKQGIHQPIALEPNVLLETGRAAYRGPIQLFPRSAMGVTVEGRWVPTSRECIVARPGRVFGSNDFAAGELAALAQLCLWLFGHSHMAEVINASRDPGSLHTAFAAKMTGEPADVMKARVKAGDKVAKNLRTAAKSTNFALGGGMGSPKFVLTNRKENAGKTTGPDGREYPGLRFCILVGGAKECGVEKLREWGKKEYAYEIPPTCKACLEVAEHVLRPLWFETWPEVKEYHAWVKRTISATGNKVPCFGPDFLKNKTHRVRDVSNASSTFSAASNAGFQSLIADITKLALRMCTREAYLDHDSVLYQANSRFPITVHDELVGEYDEETAHLAGPRVSEIMMEAYHVWIPDVYGEAEPTLMRALSKEAGPVYSPEGKLLVWEPKVK